MAIKAILLDIDGTLTNSKKEITPETLTALKNAQDRGIRLVLASGRPAKGLSHYGDLLNMWMHHGLFVCYNGARVIELHEGERSFKTWIRLKGGKVINLVTYPADFARGE